MTHIASERARLQQQGECSECLTTQAVSVGERIARKLSLSCGENCRVVVDHRAESLDGVPWRETAIRAAMKGSNDLCQTRHGEQRKPSLFRHVVIELGLIEAAHDKRPLHHVAFAAKTKLAIGTLCYRDDFEIELRRRAPIDAKLIEQGIPPPLECREIEKQIFDLAFDLVGARSRSNWLRFAKTTCNTNYKAAEDLKPREKLRAGAGDFPRLHHHGEGAIHRLRFR